MHENTFFTVDYSELMKAKVTADALIGLIRNKKENYAEISRGEIELLYTLYCKDGEKA